MSVIQRLALGLVKTPAGNMRRMYYHEMLDLARGACEAQGLGYSVKEVLGEVRDPRGTWRGNARKQDRAAAQRRGQTPEREVLVVPDHHDAGADAVPKGRQLSANYGYPGPHLPEGRSEASETSEEWRAKVRGSVSVVQRRAREDP